MVDTKVASRYAKSLIGLAQEQNLLEEVKKDMEIILNACHTSKEFQIVLKSPIIKGDKKLAIIKEAFGGLVSTLTISFIEILTRKGREIYMQGISAEYIRQYREIKKIVTAKVITAVPLDDTLRAKIAALVKNTASSVEIEEKVDPIIIGGLIVTVGDRQIDASISGKINALRKDFSKNLYVKEY
jgi:F-type H+-transporting ATPase subunit delta